MILEAKNLNKAYQNGSKNLPVLVNLNLKVADQETITIMGPSGSGKSTLLHILGTLDKPDSGSVIINEEDISTFSEKQISRLRNRDIGFIFQFHHLLPEFTAMENVIIPAYIYGNSENKIKKTKELFEYVGLSERMEHYPSQLSGGERLRVAVLRALVNNPSIIFADEPTGNLDAENAEKLLQLFKNISNDFQQSLVITTHNKDVANLGDKQLLLQNGSLKNL